MLLNKFKPTLALLFYLAIGVNAAPAPIESESSGMVTCNGNAITNSTDFSGCYVVRPQSSQLQKRTDVGKVYYDNYGNVKMILTWVINSQLAQAFDNSGYSLAKDIFNECRRWGIEKGTLREVYLAQYADWSGAMDYKTRYLNNLVNVAANYATIGVVAKTASSYASETAQIMANWMAQGPDGVEVVNLGNTNALTYGSSTKKRDQVLEEPDLLEAGATETSGSLKPRATDWCTVPIGGTYNAGSPAHTPRALFYSVTC